MNLFDRLSYFILKKKLDEKDFRLEYRQMLSETIKNDKDGMFESSKTSYKNMLILNERWAGM